MKNGFNGFRVGGINFGIFISFLVFENNTRKMLGDNTGIPLPDGYVTLASKTLDLINMLVQVCCFILLFAISIFV